MYPNLSTIYPIQGFTRTIPSFSTLESSSQPQHYRGSSPVYRRAHDENIALQTEIRVLRSLYDSFKDYNRTPPPAQPLPHPHESSRSSFSLPEPYRRSSDATAIPRFNRVDFPMITCWTSAEFKAWNDAYKKLGKDERKGTTQDFIQGEDGQPISPIQTEQIREWIGTAWKECFGAKANDQRFLGKNYSQIDSTYTNQLLHAFIERFPLLGYCDGYFKALYFLNTASYTRKRSIVLTEKKAQIKTELKDSQPILKNTGRPLEVNSKERKTSKKRKESGDDDIYLRKKKKATTAEDSPSINVAENLNVETNVPSPDYTNQQPQPPLQPYTFTEPPLRSQTCDSQSVTSPSTFIPPGTECTAITMTMEAAELVPGGLTNRAGSGDDGVQEPIKDLVDDVSTGTGFDAGSYIPPAAADPLAGASSLLLLANASHTHASQKTAWPSSRLQPDIPSGSPLSVSDAALQSRQVGYISTAEHSTQIPTSEQPPPASLSSLTQLLNLPPGSIPPPTLPSVAIPRVQKPTGATAMCGRSVGVSKIGSGGRSVGAIASGGGGGGVDTTNGAGSGLGTGGRGERERGKRAVDGGEDVSGGSVSRSTREISGNSGATLVKGWSKYLWTLSSLTRQLLLRIDSFCFLKVTRRFAKVYIFWPHWSRLATFLGAKPLPSASTALQLTLCVATPGRPGFQNVWAILGSRWWHGARHLACFYLFAPFCAALGAATIVYRTEKGGPDCDVPSLSAQLRNKPTLCSLSEI
ncbi:hypothetical protein BT69DRAFT_1296794 [Atractiella rhizophila]|nr:hypothetical protein BT69DRAFT_1296794 [Atractiella rhizophila]